MPKIREQINTKVASFMLILSEANGLFFLNGCNLSASTSKMSLNMYTEEAINENEKKAVVAFNNNSTLIWIPESTTGRKINKFFTH